MNAYYRDKINGLIMRMAERLVEYYIDYKVYRSIFGDVMGFDWHIDWTPAYDKHCPEFHNSLDDVMSRSETANIWKYPENTVSWPKVKESI